jgi:hypothetical protein
MCMSRRTRHSPRPEQLCLALDDQRNRPPAAPAASAILEALAELLLAAAETMTEGWQNDAREDHR